MMTLITADDLAKRLPLILQALAAGEEFVLTDDGRPVGRIIPTQPSYEASSTLDQQRRIFEDWMISVEARPNRYPAGFVLDDSYQAMYGEREDVQR